jgi:hypothetical protein
MTAVIALAMLGEFAGMNFGEFMDMYDEIFETEKKEKPKTVVAPVSNIMWQVWMPNGVVMGYEEVEVYNKEKKRKEKETVFYKYDRTCQTVKDKVIISKDEYYKR